MNDLQAHALEVALLRRNVFVTGSGGTGKTFWIHSLCETLLRDRYGGSKERFGEAVVLVAPTGIAATAIGGSTINSSLGIGIPVRIEDFDKVRRPQNRRRIAKWEVMVIDEVSMLSGDFLEQLDRVLRSVRPSSAHLPFGGVQIICVGDFYQLPPIFNKAAYGFKNAGFAFQAEAWRQAGFVTVVLDKPFRQEGDRRFARLLNKVRSADAESAAMALADIAAECRNGCRRMAERLQQGGVEPADDGIRPTRIYALNVDVDKINEQQLGDLGTPVVGFECHDTVDDSTRKKKYEKHEFFKGGSLKLAVGAQVMLTKTLCFADNLVNGSRGVVVEVRKNESIVYVRFKHGVVPIGVTEFKSEVIEMHDGQPRVVILKRRQVPLKLAWAVTVHKSQGMTLDRATLSLQSMFASGHAYVALSRVRSLDSLEILDMPADGRELYAWATRMINVDPLVQQFYGQLERSVPGAALPPPPSYASAASSASFWKNSEDWKALV